MSAPHHHHSHEVSRKVSPITVAFWINTVFALFEIGGGFYLNSVSVLSNALHDLGDSLSLGCAFYFEKVAHKKSDEVYTYGYKRFALLGAFINSLVLIIGSVFLLEEAIHRFFQVEPVNAKGIFFMAVAGVFVNGIAALRLKRGSSVNERVVSLHFIEDMLGWLAMLVGGVVMLVVHVPILDPILSVGISATILFNVFKNLKMIWRVILQGTPDRELNEKIEAGLKSIEGIVSHHDVHVWSLDGRYNIASLHLVLAEADAKKTEQIKNSVRSNLNELNLHHVTIETEIGEPVCQDCGLS